MEKKRRNRITLCIIVVILSISTTVIPNEAIASYGLFGEVKTSAIVQERQICVELLAPFSVKECSTKGINIINLWFMLLAIIICHIFISYSSRLGWKDTIVSLKVRMDD